MHGWRGKQHPRAVRSKSTIVSRGVNAQHRPASPSQGLRRRDVLGPCEPREAELRVSAEEVLPVFSVGGCGLLADLCSVNGARQIRILWYPALLLCVFAMNNMCSGIKLTALFSRNNSGSSGF